MTQSRVPLRIGTRGSALALWQTERIRSLLRAAGQETERVLIKTTGDLAPEIPLARIGSRALFTKQIDDALLEGRIDLAVHSLKDLPTQLPDGIAIGAVGSREDPSDALVARQPLRWSELPRAGVIGTSSLRRRAQLLATAGLVRLGLEQRIGERLPTETMLPAPGQGALAVTVRSDDTRVAAAVRRVVHDPAAAIPVSAERAFLRGLEGGCQVPVAAYGELNSRGHRPGLRLHGRVVATGGEAMVEGHQSGPAANEEEAAAIGAELAQRLLEEGAGTILSGARAAGAPAVTEP